MCPAAKLAPYLSSSLSRSAPMRLQSSCPPISSSSSSLCSSTLTITWSEHQTKPRFDEVYWHKNFNFLRENQGCIFRFKIIPPLPFQKIIFPPRVEPFLNDFLRFTRIPAQNSKKFTANIFGNLTP